MVMLDACTGLSPGIQIIQCINEQAQYLPTIIIVFVLFFILMAALNLEKIKIRIATACLISTVIAGMFSVVELLPDRTLGFFIAGAIASIAVLAFDRYG